MKNVFNLKIHSRGGTLFSGQVNSITAMNKTGIFDILPMHSNFISLIQNKISYREAENNQLHDVIIDQAVLRAYGNIVDIYLGLTRSK